LTLVVNIWTIGRVDARAVSQRGPGAAVASGRWFPKL